jgi:deoxyinosine 3'endonuclease (endonuclease V)
VRVVTGELEIKPREVWSVYERGLIVALARWTRSDIARWYSIKFGVSLEKAKEMADVHINWYGYQDPSNMRDKLTSKVKRAV